MLRRVGSETMIELQRAALGSDFELDNALLRVGVLAPLDLDPIRTWLTMPGCHLEFQSNSDGHRVITVRQRGRSVAWVHHDGHVATADNVRSIA